MNIMHTFEHFVLVLVGAVLYALVASDYQHLANVTALRFVVMTIAVVLIIGYSVRVLKNGNLPRYAFGTFAWAMVLVLNIGKVIGLIT